MRGKLVSTAADAPDDHNYDYQFIVHRDNTAALRSEDRSGEPVIAFPRLRTGRFGLTISAPRDRRSEPGDRRSRPATRGTARCSAGFTRRRHGPAWATSRSRPQTASARSAF
jgi:hypothetical protein